MSNKTEFRGRAGDLAKSNAVITGVGLTERERRALMERLCGDGKTHSQIAKLHGIKLESSRKRLWRARRKLSAAGITPRMTRPLPN